MIVEIKIDYEKCIGCKECVKVCSYGVLDWLDGAPVVVNLGNCAVCLKCEKNAPLTRFSIKKNDDYEREGKL